MSKDKQKDQDKKMVEWFEEYIRLNSKNTGKEKKPEEIQ